VNIPKSEGPFACGEHIVSSLDKTFAEVKRERHLSGIDLPALPIAGLLSGEINAAHPFREGNGRTQREFIRQFGTIFSSPFRSNWRSRFRV